MSEAVRPEELDALAAQALGEPPFSGQGTVEVQGAGRDVLLELVSHWAPSQGAIFWCVLVVASVGLVLVASRLVWCLTTLLRRGPRRAAWPSRVRPR